MQFCVVQDLQQNPYHMKCTRNNQGYILCALFLRRLNGQGVSKDEKNYVFYHKNQVICTVPNKRFSPFSLIFIFHGNISVVTKHIGRSIKKTSMKISDIVPLVKVFDIIREAIVQENHQNQMKQEENDSGVKLSRTKEIHEECQKIDPCNDEA